MTDPTSLTAPVSQTNRIQSIDTLRGVALFGILIMNIVAFGLPFGSYFNPVVDASVDGLNLEGLNLTAYMVMDVFFEGSMRTIFSMLFGAGVILFTTKSDPTIPVADLYFRRTMLLVAFGVFDAYVLLWVGDILYVYGLAGLFLFVFRNSPPTRLAAYGIGLLSVMALLQAGAQSQMSELYAEVQQIELIDEAAWTEEQAGKVESYQTFRADNFELPEQTAEDLALRKSDSYLTIMAGLAPVNVMLQSILTYAHTLWDALAMMLLGMALFKWGCFDASRSLRFYLGLTVVGFGVGIPVNYLEVVSFIEGGFQTFMNMSAIRPTYDAGRLLMALGFIGLVMTICKLGWLTLLRKALASVGQMALTNYLSHSVICNVIFMGFGFGLVGELQRYELYYIVFGIWAFQLVFSPIWLNYFRFGPVEWLWRSMTYREWQPFRRVLTLDAGTNPGTA